MPSRYTKSTIAPCLIEPETTEKDDKINYLSLQMDKKKLTLEILNAKCVLSNERDSKFKRQTK